MDNLTATMPITDREFRELAALIYNKIGVHLTEHKRMLVVGRLQSIIRELGMNSFSQYIEYVQGYKSQEAFTQLVNRITTNYTSFAREKDHFDYFKDVILPDLRRAFPPGDSYMERRPLDRAGAISPGHVDDGVFRYGLPVVESGGAWDRYFVQSTQRDKEFTPRTKVGG